MLHSTLTSKGQTTVPSAVRDALRMKTGDTLLYEVTGDRVMVRVHPGTRSLAGVLASDKGKGRSFKEIREAAAKASVRSGR